MMLKNSGYTKDMIREHIHLRSVHEMPMIRDRGSAGPPAGICK
jgi:hypothetical protein